MSERDETMAVLTAEIERLRALVQRLRDCEPINVKLAREDGYRRGYNAGLSNRATDDRSAYQRGYRAGRKVHK